MEDIKKLLKKIYLFKNFSDDEIDDLSDIAKKTTLRNGEKLFDEKQEADCMFVIKYGSVNLYKNDDDLIRTLGVGAHFGELPFLDKQPRALKVVAAEDTTLFQLPYKKLEILLNKNQELALDFYKELAHFLATRLRKITTDLDFARHNHLKHF